MCQIGTGKNKDLDIIKFKKTNHVNSRSEPGKNQRYFPMFSTRDKIELKEYADCVIL